MKKISVAMALMATALLAVTACGSQNTVESAVTSAVSDMAEADITETDAQDTSSSDTTSSDTQDSSDSSIQNASEKSTSDTNEDGTSKIGASGTNEDGTSKTGTEDASGKGATQDRNAQESEGNEDKQTGASNMVHLLEDAESIELVEDTDRSLPEDVTINWADDVDLSDGTLVTFTYGEDSDYQTEIVFQTSRELKDFTFLSLAANGINDDNLLMFNATPVFLQEYTEADVPLVITLTFNGDTPEYGFSYVDEKQDKRFYGIDISGESGELYFFPLTDN